MGYMHINNLYKDQNIMMFKECYALEKIHGTSAHITFKPSEGLVTFFSGGEKHENFVKLFNIDDLKYKFVNTFPNMLEEVIVYGEAYGGKCQGMSDTYGKELKFIAFEVSIGEKWLSVPYAESVVKSLGLEFVDYVRINTTLTDIDYQRDRDSVQAVRNGCGHGKAREGVVLRPLEEFTLNNGERIMCKHKGDAFKETATARKVVPLDKLEIIKEADKIAFEWVTLERLKHVLDKLPVKGVENTPDVIKAMVEDVYREGKGELIESKEANKAIGKRTAFVFKNYLMNNIKE